MHRCIFERDLRQFSQLLRTEQVGEKDKHGGFSGRAINHILTGRKTCGKSTSRSGYIYSTPFHWPDHWPPPNSFSPPLYLFRQHSTALVRHAGQKGWAIEWICDFDIFYINQFNFPVPEFTHLLLAHQAPVKVKNLQGWSPLSEAISYGDRQISEYMFMY